MNFAVVVVHVPPRTINSPWPAFQHDVQSTGEPGASETRPSDNVWLLRLPNDTPMLACVVDAAQGFHLAHRVLYFDQLPQEYAAPAQ